MTKYKFSNKNHAEGGIVSCLMGLGALAGIILAVYLSYKRQGAAGELVGNLALASFLLSFFGTVIVYPFRREITVYALPKVAAAHIINKISDHAAALRREGAFHVHYGFAGTYPQKKELQSRHLGIERLCSLCYKRNITVLASEQIFRFPRF